MFSKWKLLIKLFKIIETATLFNKRGKNAYLIIPKLHMGFFLRNQASKKFVENHFHKSGSYF